MNKSMFISGLIACIIAGLCFFLAIKTYDENKTFIANGKFNDLESAVAEDNFRVDGEYYKGNVHFVIDNFYVETKKILGIEIGKYYYYAIILDNGDVFALKIQEKDKATADKLALIDFSEYLNQMRDMREKRRTIEELDLPKIPFRGRLQTMPGKVADAFDDYLDEQGMTYNTSIKIHKGCIDTTRYTRIIYILDIVLLVGSGSVLGFTGIASIIPKNLSSGSSSKRPSKKPVKKKKKGPKDKYDDLADALADDAGVSYAYTTGSNIGTAPTSKESAYTFSSNVLDEDNAEATPLTFDGMLTASSDKNEKIDISSPEDLIDITEIKDAGPIDLGNMGDEISLDGTEKEVELIKFNDDEASSSVSI